MSATLNSPQYSQISGSSKRSRSAKLGVSLGHRPIKSRYELFPTSPRLPHCNDELIGSQKGWCTRMKQATVPSASHQGSCATGVEGLDEVLVEGLPSNCFYLIQGDPGSGKTTLALQFLFEGIRRGEKTLYITLSETKEELLKVAHSHGWSLDSIALFELSAIEALVRPEAQTTVFHPSELELTKVTDLLLNEIRKTRPARIVFDSLSEFRLLAETPLRYRRQL